jgi:hypothetical protein
LSDGKNYYAGFCVSVEKSIIFIAFLLGFVIDQSVLNLTHADVYAIVCIKKLLMLRDCPGK